MKLQQMSQSPGHCPNALKTLGNALKTLGIGKALRRLPGIRTFLKTLNLTTIICS